MTTDITEVEALRFQNLTLRKQMIDLELNTLIGVVYRRAGIADADFDNYLIDTNTMKIVKKPDEAQA